MKVVNSLKTLKKRDRNCRVIRRRGRVYVINKVNKRYFKIRFLADFLFIFSNFMKLMMRTSFKFGISLEINSIRIVAKHVF